MTALLPLAVCAVWCAISYTVGRHIINRHHPPVSPPRAAVEPATDVSPSQAPAPPPEIVALTNELHRAIEEAKLRYWATTGIRQLESLLAHPANGDDCPPHGMPRPEVDE